MRWMWAVTLGALAAPHAHAQSPGPSPPAAMGRMAGGCESYTWDMRREMEVWDRPALAWPALADAAALSSPVPLDRKLDPGTGITGLVVGRQVLTPLDLERTYGLAGGHPSHGEGALDQLFLARPLLGWGRYRGPLPGLYMRGAGTHPGGGVTAGPAANAAREILADLK